MKKISRRLLNKTVVVTKFAQVFNINGDVSNTRAVVDSCVKMRIVNNETSKSEFGITPSGKFATSSHLGFCDCDKDIDIGYFVEDGTKKYSVDGIDDEPGGVTDHHIEVGMTIVKPV